MNLNDIMAEVLLEKFVGELEVELGGKDFPRAVEMEANEDILSVAWVDNQSPYSMIYAFTEYFFTWERQTREYIIKFQEDEKT